LARGRSTESRTAAGKYIEPFGSKKCTKSR
jgi:hypothetical protein